MGRLTSMFRVSDVAALSVRLGLDFGCRPWLAARLSRRVGGVPRAPGVLPFAQRIRSSQRARRRWRSSRAASWPRFALVAKAVNRCPSTSVNRSCAPGWGLSLRTMTRIPAGQWSAAVFEPAFPGRRAIARGSPFPLAPGAASPARPQARSLAAARADRIAFSARGKSPASWLTSRDTTGSDATGPASCGCSRSTAMSARQSPPRATAAARSATTFPWSWTARGARHLPRPSDRPRARPVTRIVSHSRTAPAWETRPRPSADTATRAARALFFTWKVPSAR